MGIPTRAGPIPDPAGPIWNSQSGGPLRDNTSGGNKYLLLAPLTLHYIPYALSLLTLSPLDDLLPALPPLASRDFF